MNNPESLESAILSLDPGRDKCGVAVMNDRQQVVYHRVIDAKNAIAQIEELCDQFAVGLIVVGDGTTSSSWCEQIKQIKQIKSGLLRGEIPVVTVNEKNSTVEARDRYWLMYPPKGLQRIVPQGLRVPPRSVDDLVAILLIERYLAAQG